MLHHGFFLEDAAETHNRIEGNLGLVTRSSSSLLDTDTTPVGRGRSSPGLYERER
jgi:hypothetical protein